MTFMSNVSNSAPTTRQLLEVDEPEVGQRVDNYLIRKLKGVPRTYIYRIIREGQVRRNGRRIKPRDRLDHGDVIRIPPMRRSEPKSVERLPSALAGLPERILFQDDEYLVLDKPAGVSVHGGQNESVGVIEALRFLGIGGGYIELVHRLDKETSGCLLFAMNADSLRHAHRLLRSSESSESIDKHYIALLHGHWTGEDRRIHLPLRDKRSGGIRQSVVAEGGRHATTLLSPRRRWPNHTLVDVQLFTGRMHQIRAHAKALGLPVAGDRRYGDRKLDRSLRDDHGLRRLFLHASSLLVPRPGRRPLRVECPMPEDLESVLTSLDRS
jgi:23S rRNA pseudouridine955/2504/2580 synthase